MGVLEDIRGKILRRQYEFSRHAVDQSILRNVSVMEVEEAILGRSSEVIEDYPEDKYGPSCLILGGLQRQDGRCMCSAVTPAVR